MAAVTLTPDDLTPFAVIDETKALAMIADALALAARVAPCINDADFEYAAAARAVLRRAVLRRNDAGSGAVQQEAVDDVSQTFDTRQSGRGLFWPSEIEQLQELCRSSDVQSGAFTVDSISTCTVHADICSFNFGAVYCSCGADIAGFPLWEVTP